MTINSKYLIMSPLQQVLHDKLDGALLANGTVTFYKDNARSIKKDIFQITGNPPDYGYDVLPNPLILSSIGSYIDTVGNNIIPLLYPYDDSGNIELYYIKVESEDAREQFTVSGWPQVGATSTETIGTDNFIPNGQFLLQNYISKDGKLDNSAITNVAYGGWTFERPVGTTSTDIITFERYGSYVTNPSSSPRYAMKIVAEIPSISDAFKYICVKFDDVNKFASDTQEWTFSFYAETISAPLTVTPSIKKFYGTGGDAPTYHDYQDITITTQGNQFNITIIFGNNTGKIIGTNNDDYVQLILKTPPTYSYGIKITDACLLRNRVTVIEYPVETTSQVISKTLGGGISIPSYSAMDLGLCPILTKTGLAFDHSLIGTSILLNSNDIPFGYLLENGAQYETSEISSDGIPYKRLQQSKAIWDAIHRLPKFGTGKEFVSVLNGSGGPNTLPLLFQENTFGTTTAISDGTPATGFTFSNLSSGIINGYGFYGYPIDTATFIVSTFAFGSTGGCNAGTSGFTFNDISNGDGENPPIYQYTALAATGLAGKYLNIYTQTTYYYVWYKVSGSGSDPAPPGGTGILVNILTADLAKDVMLKTLNAINAVYSCSITTTAASTITAGAYLNFYSPQPYNQHYVVWYKKNGSGTEPVVSGAKLIEVNIVDADTAIQVGEKTLVAINSVYYCVPDKRGQFLRFWDDQAGFDPDSQNGIIQMSMNAAGTGYVLGDIVNVVQAGASGGSIRVTAINGGGGITGFIRDGVGTSGGYGINYNNGAATASGGSGSNATFNINKVGQTREPAAYDNGVSFIYGDNPGSRQYAQYLTHNHYSTFFQNIYDTEAGDGRAAGLNAQPLGTTPTTYNGGAESRGLNVYLASAIKY